MGQWEAGESKEGSFPIGFGGRVALPTPWYWTFGLWSCEIINFCCFKLPKLVLLCYNSSKKLIETLNKFYFRKTPLPQYGVGVISTFNFYPWNGLPQAAYLLLQKKTSFNESTDITRDSLLLTSKFPGINIPVSMECFHYQPYHIPIFIYFFLCSIVWVFWLYNLITPTLAKDKGLIVLLQ